MLSGRRNQRILSTRKMIGFRNPSSPRWHELMSLVYLISKAHRRIMSHLVGHVLPASNLLRIYTDLLQEQLGPRQEIPQSLVVDDFLLSDELKRWQR